MIKKIINNYVESTISKIIKRQKHIQREQFAYTVINQLFSEPYFIPFTSWTISPSTIQHILNDVEINQRSCIVEFGAGASTIFIAKLIKTNGLKASFFVVESDKEWALKVAGYLKSLKIEDYVTIILAPIIKVPENISYKKQESWYDTAILESAFADIKSIDVLLVDGPYAKATNFARYSALPYFYSKMSQGCSVFIDDVDRSDEREIALEWSKKFNFKVRFFNRYAMLTNGNSYITTPYGL